MNTQLAVETLCFAELSHQISIEGLVKPRRLVLDQPIRLGVDDLNSPYVSQAHIEVELDRDGVWVVDLGSKNGSRMDAHRLAPNVRHPWPLGATLTLANCPLRLAIDASVSAPVDPSSIVDEAAILECAQQAMIQAPDAKRSASWWCERAAGALNSDQIRRFEALLTGFGPVEELLADPDVSEIMVLGDRPIWVERGGRIERTDHCFPNHEWLVRVIERILRVIGREINQSSPVCDGRLEDGSRVNAVLPPVSLDGPALTIRKFQSRANSLHAWVEQKALPAQWADWLADQVSLGRDILVVGGTGAGKTTLLNALAQHIPCAERLVSIEDAAELDLNHAHWIRLETRAPQGGHAGLDSRALLVNALRMRPDRILLGEVRGAEALELVQALNTGHRGCLSTLHANHAQAAARRMEMLLMLSGLDWPLIAVREQIACALDLVVGVERTPDGQRRVSGIYELSGMDDHGYQWEAHYRGDQRA